MGYKVEKLNISEEDQNKIYDFARKNQSSPDSKKFIIFGQGRTGSSLFCDTLDSHSDIKCSGEILKGPRIDPMLYVDGLSKMFPEPHYGFKVKPYHLMNLELKPRKFLDHFYERGWSIVHLRRENIFRQFLSLQLAHSTKKWHSSKKIKVLKVIIDTDKMLEFLKEGQRLLKMETEILYGLPNLKIVYEQDLIKDSQIAANKVFDFIGVPRQPTNAFLQRITPPNWVDLVENVDEVKTTLEENDFIGFSNSDETKLGSNHK